MPKSWPTKDPDEQLDYTYEWADDLEEGETIATHAFEVTNAAGTTVESDSHGPTTVTAVISGGTDGEEAAFIVRITTSADRTFEDSVVLPIASSIAPVEHPCDYTPVTPAHLVWAFPEFSTVPINRIQFHLNRASTLVDTTWQECDYALAIMLAAAHLMTTNGLGETAEAKAIANGSDQFRSIKVGSLALERFDETKNLASSRWAGTTYGRRFQRLLHANKVGPRVTGAIRSGFGYGDNFGPWTA